MPTGWCLWIGHQTEYTWNPSEQHASDRKKVVAYRVEMMPRDEVLWLDLKSWLTGARMHSEGHDIPKPQKLPKPSVLL